MESTSASSSLLTSPEDSSGVECWGSPEEEKDASQQWDTGDILTIDGLQDDEEEFTAGEERVIQRHRQHGDCTVTVRDICIQAERPYDRTKIPAAVLQELERLQQQVIKWRQLAERYRAEIAALQERKRRLEWEIEETKRKRREMYETLANAKKRKVLKEIYLQ